MTIATIATMARHRSAPPRPPGARHTQRATTDPEAAGGERAAVDVSGLANAVPVDVIVLYTTVIGVLAGVLKDASVDSYLPLRWTIYLGCIVGICVLVPLTYTLHGGAETEAGPPPPPPPPPPPGPPLRPGPPLPAGPPLPQHGDGGWETQPVPTHVPRRVPVSETVVAVLAFGFWGLVVPGSPLYVMLKPPTLPVTITTLSAVGVFVLTSIAAPLLKRPARPGRSPKAPIGP